MIFTTVLFVTTITSVFFGGYFYQNRGGPLLNWNNQVDFFKSVSSLPEVPTQQDGAVMVNAMADDLAGDIELLAKLPSLNNTIIVDDGLTEEWVQQMVPISHYIPQTSCYILLYFAITLYMLYKILIPATKSSGKSPLRILNVY